MELLSGGTVADRLRSGGGGRVTRSRVFAWLEQAAAALDYAHAADIVHRDVKPANLLLDDRERLAVADFGIARVADDTNLTQVGQVVGTAAYLSPEQATGEQATAASDRYALGVVAYELLCGRRPFQGEHVAAQARQHVESEVPDSGLGPEVDEVLRRAMAKDPGERYATSARFVEELQAVSARIERPDTEVTRPVAAAAPPRRREPLAPPPPPPSQPARRDSRGGGGWKLLAGLAVLAALVAVAAIALAGGGEDPSSEQASEPQSTQERQTQPEEQQNAPQQTQEQPATPAPAETQPPDNEPESGAGPVTEGNESPSQLDARGYQLLQQGQAEQAVPLLEQAVKGFEAQGSSADSTGYGYALYNLGTAYLETGRAAEAIPLFEKRLEVSPNDRPGTVRKSLKQAQREAGQGGGEDDG
jgi:serine/threonine-protein kinase